MLRTLIASAAIALAPLPALAGPRGGGADRRGCRRDFRSGERRGSLHPVDRRIAAVARFALGKHARRVSAEEQARFTEALSVFLADTFRENAGTFQRSRHRRAGVDGPERVGLDRRNPGQAERAKTR
jgi:hypothetical protein